MRGSTNEIDKISVRRFPVGSTAPGHRKLELYVQEAIRSVGLVPARMMSMDQEIGTVEAGRPADSTVIAGGSAWRYTQHAACGFVITNKTVYRSAELRKSLGFKP